MLQIALATLPNQTLSFRVDDDNYNFTIKETNGCMCATIVRNNEVLLSNTRLVAQEPIIPYKYLEKGTFVLDTLNEELPDWRQFGISQSLIYISAAELGAIRGGT